MYTKIIAVSRHRILVYDQYYYTGYIESDKRFVILQYHDHLLCKYAKINFHCIFGILQEHLMISIDINHNTINDDYSRTLILQTIIFDCYVERGNQQATQKKITVQSRYEL